MKKQLVSLIGFIFIGTTTQAQNTIFFENFDDDLSPLNAWNLKWTVTERDGNNYSWHTFVPSILFSSSQGKVAVSYASGGNEDNLLTSSVIPLPPLSSALSFKVATDGYLSTMHYAVYILEGNATFQGTEVPIFEETLNSAQPIVTRSVNIPNNYLGRGIKLCFRNFQNKGENQIFIDDVRIATGSVLAVSESSKSDKKINVYPNPVKNQLNIESLEKVFSAEVFDMTGRSTQVKVNDLKNINISSLKSGDYIIKIETKEGITTKKITKE